MTDAPLNRIVRIEVDEYGEVDFFFEGSDEPWTVNEFEEGSQAFVRFDIIEQLIRDWNEKLVPPKPPTEEEIEARREEIDRICSQWSPSFPIDVEEMLREQ